MVYCVPFGNLLLSHGKKLGSLLQAQEKSGIRTSFKTFGHSVFQDLFINMEQKPGSVHTWSHQCTTSTMEERCILPDLILYSSTNRKRCLKNTSFLIGTENLVCILEKKLLLYHALFCPLKSTMFSYLPVIRLPWIKAVLHKSKRWEILSEVSETHAINMQFLFQFRSPIQLFLFP